MSHLPTDQILHLDYSVFVHLQVLVLSDHESDSPQIPVLDFNIICVDLRLVALLCEHLIDHLADKRVGLNDAEKRLATNARVEGHRIDSLRLLAFLDYVFDLASLE